MPVIPLANSFSELSPLNGLFWFALCLTGLTSACCIQSPLLPLASDQVCRRSAGRKKKKKMSRYLFLLPSSMRVAVAVSLQFAVSIGHHSSSHWTLAIGHSRFSPLSLNPRHSNHFPLYLVSVDLIIHILLS